MSEPPREPLLFEALITPHRSLAPRGFLLLMGTLAGLSFGAGLGFVLLGAWPVVGFLGLEVLLVWVAFRISYRRARQYERLLLTRDALTVERMTFYGQRRAWTFQPASPVSISRQDTHPSVGMVAATTTASMKNTHSVQNRRGEKGARSRMP